MSLGWLILLDCPPRTTLVVDRVTVRVRSGFRGFHSVPPGKHVAELEYYSGERSQIEAEIPAGGASVWEFFNLPPRLEASPPDRAAALEAEARSGRIGSGLWRFPPPDAAGEWIPPEAVNAPEAAPARPAAPVLPESRAEKRRYYAIVAALYAAALAGGWLLVRALLPWWDAPPGGGGGLAAWAVGLGAPLALVSYLVIRSRGFRLVR